MNRLLGLGRDVSYMENRKTEIAGNFRIYSCD
jgi:hypothetical protein